MTARGDLVRVLRPGPLVKAVVLSEPLASLTPEVRICTRCEMRTMYLCPGCERYMCGQCDPKGCPLCAAVRDFERTEGKGVKL